MNAIGKQGRLVPAMIVALSLALVLAGCQGKLFTRKKKPDLPVVEECLPEDEDCIVVQTPDENTVRPQYRKTTAPAGEGFVEGIDPEELDATTEEEKEAALESSESGGEKELGRTIASLGDVADQGFWLKTPLVIAVTEGRVVWADDGTSVNVTLIPKQGEATAGSQISLAAMRALGIPLTALPELIVFAK